MATKKQSESVESVEALVLLNCGFGDAGQVVLLPLADAQVGFANGMLDLSIKAVDAAKAA
jgi:hypothetical protein